MTKLQQYVDAVLDDDDRVLMAEASNCLAAGAPRAAYLMVWLAIAESLRRKFVASEPRDDVAGKIMGEIRQREAAHKAVDALLIERAAEYGLITDAEKTRLRHLYERRNVFGHPYEESPSVQIVKAAAAEAVEIVLSRQLVLRHGYLEQQVRRLTTDETFLSDDDVSVSDYARIVHSRSAQDLRVWFVKKMWQGLEAVFADPSFDRLQRRGIWFMRAFLLEDPGIFGTWDPVDDLPDHKSVIAGILADEDLFTHLSEHAGDIVINVLVDQAASDPMSLPLLFGLVEAGVLSGRQRADADDVIAGYPLARVVRAGLPLRAYAHRVIDDLSIHTWDVQNAAMRHVTNAGPTGIAELDDELQEDLGRNVLQAADGNAFAAQDFLNAMPDGQIWPAAFIRGLVVEPFISESGELRLKPLETKRAVRTLASIPQPERDAVIDHLLAGLDVGKPRSAWEFKQHQPEVVKLLRGLATESDLPRVGEIANAVTAVSC